jgi:hypothetical protein
LEEVELERWWSGRVTATGTSDRPGERAEELRNWTMSYDHSICFVREAERCYVTPMSMVLRRLLHVTWRSNLQTLFEVVTFFRPTPRRAQPEAFLGSSTYPQIVISITRGLPGQACSIGPLLFNTLGSLRQGFPERIIFRAKTMVLILPFVQILTQPFDSVF